MRHQLDSQILLGQGNCFEYSNLVLLNTDLNPLLFDTKYIHVVLYMNAHIYDKIWSNGKKILIS